jgi:uncharacterized protein (DUF58 family)
MAQPNKMDSLYTVLTGVDKTYNKLPLNLRLQIEKISQGLSEYGPRKLQRRGVGTEFFESRDFRPDSDEPRNINARLSGRAGKPIVVEKEAEIRQHFYLWRDPSYSMDYSSSKNLVTKKQAGEIMLLALAKHLARNEELIGILDRKGTYRGGKASETLANHLDVNIVTGTMPVVGRKLPANSTAILFSDFLMDRDTLMRGMSELTGTGLKGYLIMTLDPQEIDFKYKGHVEFNGLEGEGKERFKKAESMRSAYQDKMREHMDWLETMCKAKGFTLILQRTDEPLHNALMKIYGLHPNVPARTFSPKL